MLLAFVSRVAEPDLSNRYATNALKPQAVKPVGNRKLRQVFGSSEPGTLKAKKVQMESNFIEFHILAADKKGLTTSTAKQVSQMPTVMQEHQTICKSLMHLPQPHWP